MAPTKQEQLHLWNVALITNKSVWLLQQSFKSTNIMCKIAWFRQYERLRPHEWNTYCLIDYLSLYFHLLHLSAARTFHSSQLHQRVNIFLILPTLLQSKLWPPYLKYWHHYHCKPLARCDCFYVLCIKGHVSFLRNQWKKEILIRSANTCRQRPGLSALVQQLGFSCSWSVLPVKG